MRKAVIYILIAGIVPFSLYSCKKKAEEKAAEPLKRAGAPKPAVTAPSGEKAEEEAVETGIDVKLRNPFQSHILVQRGTEGEKKAKGPLECCEVNSFKVVAVVVSTDSSFALLQAPDTKRYIVRKGDLIGTNEGRIVQIGHRGILVKEHIKDEEGTVLSTTEIELNLPVDKEGAK
jgi:Tfp pilus assembly protein PilP